MTPRARCALLLAPALAACRSPTQISVDVRTDVPCSQVTVTAFIAGELGAIESIPPTTESTTCTGDHLGTVVLVPSGGDDNAEVGFKVATALNGETSATCTNSAAANDPSCIVARRALRYLPHTPLEVVVDMSLACEGVVCDSQSTCVGGVCKNATIPDPSQCEGAGCDQGVLGAAVVDAGGDATLPDATVPDATVPDGNVEDATLTDAPSDAPGADAPPPPGSDSAPPFLDAAPCDLGGLQAGSPWPMSGYCPNLRARSPLVGPATAEYKWQAALPTGFNYGGVTIDADGTVYVATVGYTTTGFDGGVVEALFPDGGVRWIYAPDGGAAFETTPVIAADSTLRVWDYSAGTYNVLATDGAVVVGAAPSFLARGGITIVSGGTMYVPDNEGNLRALDENGAQLWSVPGPSNDYAVASVAANGTIFIDDRSSALAGLYPDGSTLWAQSLDAGSALTPVAIAPDGTLRVVGGDGYLYSLDPVHGTTNWRALVATPGAGNVGGFAIADDGETFLGTSAGMVAVDLAGKIAARIAVPGGAYRPILDANGDVYVACDSGAEICSFDHALTKTRWAVALPNTPGGNTDTPVIGPGGMVYVQCFAVYSVGVVYAFGPP